MQSFNLGHFSVGVGSRTHLTNLSSGILVMWPAIVAEVSIQMRSASTFKVLQNSRSAFHHEVSHKCFAKTLFLQLVLHMELVRSLPKIDDDHS